MEGYIREVFTSIQGEGIYCGKRMTFVRFLGCNLSCNYCDTPETQVMEGVFVNNGKIMQNPTNIDTVVVHVDAGIVALTGGEPLLQMEFVQYLCERLKTLGKTVYLDTNGTLPDALHAIIDCVDIVSLDFKVPTATGRPPFWKEHRACLELSSSKDVFVKMVINGDLLPRELETACSIIEQVDRSIPLVIQPVFGNDTVDLLNIQKQALAYIDDVRIIPQVHKYLHVQ
ncbi:7-carboxy-7-deazaguanine synthase QueE [candidate division WOR-3 bacterium]|nr:7-carboxy-7-deazaguanine synthase QueE [candidate division WOR-3 bacterium]